MSARRRALRILLFIATAVVALVAGVLIALQTPWARDALGRLAERRAEAALNAEVSIGRLGGTLLTGAVIENLAITRDGQTIVAVNRATVDYDIVGLLSGGFRLDRVVLEQPRVRAGAVSALIPQPRDDRPPGRPFAIDEILVRNGHVVIGPEPETLGGVRVPDEMRQVDAALGLETGPRGTTIAIDRLSFVGEAPQVTLRNLSGTVGIAEGDLVLEDMTVELAESSFEFDGRIDDFRRVGGAPAVTRPDAERPIEDLPAPTPSDGPGVRHNQQADRLDIRIERAELSFEELQRLVPALDRVRLPEDARVERLEVRGPLTALTVEFRLAAGEGRIAATVTADVAGPDRAAGGTIRFADVNLASLLERRALPSHLTATVKFDFTIDTSADVVSVTGPFALEAARVTVAGYDARSVEASGALAGQSLVVHRARARGYGGLLTAEGKVGLPFGGRPTRYALTGMAADVNLARLPDAAPLPALQTDLDLSYRLEDAGSGVIGRLQLNESQVAGATLTSGTAARFDATGERVRYTASGGVRGLDPQRIANAFGLEVLSQDRFAGALNATFSIDGAGATLDPLQLTLTESRLFGGAIPRMDATVTLGERVVRFSADGQFERLQAGTLADIPALDGVVTGTVDVDGSVARDDSFDWADLAIDGEVRVSDGSIEAIPIERAVLAGRYDDLVLRLARATVDGPALRANTSGTLAFDDATPSMLTYHVDTPQLDAFAELLGTPIEGDLTLDGRITGTGVLRIEGTVAGVDVAYAGVAATTVNATHDIALPPRDPAAATADARLDATFVRIAGRTLTETAIDAQYGMGRVAFDARVQEQERTIESTGRVVIEPGRQQLYLTSFRFEGPGSVWEMPPALDARLEYGGDRVVVDYFRLESPEGQVIVADGALGLNTAEGPLEIWIEGLALGDVDALVFGERGITGRLDAYAAVEGPVNCPAVEGRLLITNGTVQNLEYEELAAVIDSVPGGYQFTARLLQNASSWLTAEGRLPATLVRGLATGDPGGDDIHVAIRSSAIGLGFLGAFTDTIDEAEGTIEVDLEASGPINRPRFSGQLVLRNGGFGVPALGTRYAGLDTVITFEPDAVVVPELRLVDENGDALRIAGRLPYEAGRLGDVRIVLQADSFEVMDNELADLHVSTDLTVTGALFSPRLEGTVRMTDGEVRVDRILELRDPAYYRASALEKTSTEIGAQAADEGILRDAPVALAVRLQVPVLELTGRDLRGPGSIPVGLGDISVTVEGDLRLDKQVGEPVRITGDIATVRGTYEFQGRRFTIARGGQIRFPGLVEINPLLDITAEREIASVLTEVRIDGTLREPRLTLASQPPLDEADILSLIIFNQPATELGAVEQISLGRRAAALAASFVASQLAESIGDALDLDVLEIETGEVTGLSPVLTVGEQFGERLFVRLRQELGDAATSQLVLEYELTDWLRLQTAVSDERSESRSLFRRAERSALRWIFFFNY